MHFSLRAGNLVIRVQYCQTNDTILQLIPSSELRGDLPASLVDGHIHWLNLSTLIVEIRPLEKLWEESSENWKIDCAPGQYRMYRGRETLVDAQSPTWAMVSKPLRNFYTCLGNPCKCFGERSGRTGFRNGDLLITTSPAHSVQSILVPRLSVSVPRYGLSFFVNEREELESRDFQDMVYDEDQSIGALFGLENLLVLRPKTHIAGSFLPEAVIPRRVLIPNGHAIRAGDHRVEIHAGDSLNGRGGPLYYAYNVGTELGCLVGSGNPESTRYLAHLHAITCCYRPDPLTGKTGAQAALCLLQSAGCRSIMKLKSLPVDIPRKDAPSMWLTKYPQVDITSYEIQKRYYWNNYVPDAEMDAWRSKSSARRAAHLFPWNVTVPTSPEHRDPVCFLESDSEPEGNGSTAGPTTLPTLPRRVSSLHTQWTITIDQLLSNRPAPELPPCHTEPLPTSRTTPPHDIPKLNQLFSHFQISRADPPFKERYLALLETGAGVSKGFPGILEVAGEDRMDTLQKHYAQCRINYTGALRILKKRLGPKTDRGQALDQIGQWPPIMPGDLLQCLASTSMINLSVEWKRCIISLALLLLNVQRARRLLRFALDGLEEEFSKELENEGCDGWNPEEYPDWLLIQVRSSFRVLISSSVDPCVRFKEIFSFVAIRQKLRWK